MTDIEKERYRLTEKRTGSAKAPLTAALAGALAADAIAMVFLAIVGCAAYFYVFPALLIALDAVVLFLAIKGNFRFAYAFVAVAVYCIAAPIFMGLTFLLDARTASGATMTAVAFAIWLIVHIMSVLAVLASSLRAAKLGGEAVAAAAIASTILLAGAICLYIWSVAAGGFFGQGFTRTLTFEKYGEGVRITGVLDGRGDTVVVPEELDGLPVTAVDCSVFTADGVGRVELRCSYSVELTSASELSFVGPSVNIVADKEVIDDFREVFYAMGCFGAGNAMIPDGDGVSAYAVFDYTEESYEMCGGKILPTWTGSDISFFDISSYASGGPDFEYAAHADTDDQGDLYWCKENNDGYIMRLSGGAEDGVLDAEVRFDRVYAIHYDADNDARFDDYDAGSDYTVADKADELLASRSREGFSVEWISEGTVIDSLGAVLESDDAYFESGIRINAEWTLEAPEVTTDSRVSATYHDAFELRATATAPVAGYELEYSWQFGGEEVSGSSSYGAEHAGLDDAGSYLLTVSTGDNEYTSLTNETRVQVVLTVTPRDVTWIWSADGEEVSGAGAVLTYNGTDRTVGITPDGLVNGDEAEFVLSGDDGIRDADTYTVYVALGGDTSLKYRVTNYSLTVTVNKAEADVTWGGADYGADDLVYDGDVPAISASAYGLGADASAFIVGEIDGLTADAGSHTAEAVLSSEYENNYVLTNNVYSYNIERRAVTLEWESGSFVYDGTRHGIGVTGVSGAADGEEATLLGEINCTGYSSDAGTHTMTALIPTGGVWANYTCDLMTSTFEISRAALTISVPDLAKEYNGNVYLLSLGDVTVSGLVSGDRILSASMLGEGAEATDAGEYDFTAEFVVSDNYELTVVYESGTHSTLTIEKCSVTLVWQSERTFVYDGTVHSLSVTEISGCVSGEEPALLRALMYTGGSAETGSHTMTAIIPEDGVWSNYECGYVTCSYTVERASLTVTVRDLVKTYDGGMYELSLGDVTVSGLVSGDDLTIGMYGIGASATDAGEYTFSVSVIATSDYDTEVVYPGDKSYALLTIEKRSVTLVWQTDRELESDGTVKGIEVVGVEGCVADEEQTLLGLITYTGGSSEEGSHTMTAVIPSGGAWSNYDCADLDEVFEIVSAENAAGGENEVQ